MASFSHQETQSSPAKEVPRASTTKCSGGSPHRERRRRDEDAAPAGGFTSALHRTPPAPPPALLRRLGVKEPTGVGKVKVMLRVGASGEGPFTSGTQTFSLDKRKRQVTLCETAPSASAPEDRKVGVAAPKMFAFDAIFSQDDSQTEICSSALTDVIHAVINGTDGCLFCFGHAGLGKSYTMLGRPEAAGTLGAIPCAIAWLFRGIAEQRHKCGTRFSVRVSAVELCTNTNQIRDLLAPYQNDTEQSPGVYLRDDPLFGTHLQNQSELRVHSAEKAAFYLDAALATRGAKEEGKDSHLLYTLHVYQYSVGGKGAVAGGRSRLHLIDLGNSERGKSNGGIPLSGLGNILLAIFNGQRHLPYRDHNLTHVLKECLGSLTCHTAMIVHVSPNIQNYSDTLTTLQLASRIHRLRRRKMKYSSNNNAGSGGSSGEDASKPSSSEPDPSSSDLSADTVIYVGPMDDATDGEHPPVYIPHINSGDNRCVLSKALRGSAAEQRHKSSLSKVIEEKSPIHKLHSSPKASPMKTGIQPISQTPKSSPVHSAASKAAPLKKTCVKSFSEEGKSSSDEHWIDGPRISKSRLVEARHIIKETQVKKRETWIDGPMQESKTPLQFESVPVQPPTIPLQAGVLSSHGNESLGYGYMDNHKKNMIRKWVENQTSQIHKSRHNSPSHKIQTGHRDPGVRIPDDPETTHKMEPVKDSSRRIHVEESTIRTGLKAGSKGMTIEEENIGPPFTDHTLRRSSSTKSASKNEQDDDDDSEELAEIPPALPLLQPSSLSSREVSMESLDSKYKERLRMDEELLSNRSRDIEAHQLSRLTGDDEDDMLEIIEVEEPLEPVPMQDSCLQVTEEDIAFCMGLAEHPMAGMEHEDGDDHPLRILSQENLTVASTFTDTLSLYSEVERQLRNESYLRQLGFYAEHFSGDQPLADINPHESLQSSRSRIDDILGLTELYGSRRVLDGNDVPNPRIAPQFQSLSLCNVRDTEEYHGDGSVYSEPAYRPSDKICNSCKRSMSRPGSAVDDCAYQDLDVPHNDYGTFERYRGNDITDARIASLRHPDGASDPNLREEKRIPGNGAPSSTFRDLKSNLHLEVTPPVVTTEPRIDKSEKGDKVVARVVASSKPDGYDSGHESTPRTGKHSPAATSRRAESGYDSVPRDSDASSLDSYPTRRAAVARAHAKKHTTAKYKQHSDRSFCSWLRNPFTCKYADTDPEISDF
ncbi:PREDICTED: kinesin-like protein CG14535 isoform X2 [Papilio polytes]|uniref:kinesin-like protein CG14535 isoform X2 n=1 Tax=Papilio polytes TaxID=76194 RepID=UPI000675CDC1|nr:PREDICTED: kinesin-like protein CG14535 isoform X2 [Papilio polytes]